MMAETSKLKSCPFCGGEEIDIEADLYGEGYVAACRSCGAQVSDDSMIKAIESWNKRPRCDDLLAAIKEAYKEGYVDGYGDGVEIDGYSASIDLNEYKKAWDRSDTKAAIAKTERGK